MKKILKFLDIKIILIILLTIALLITTWCSKPKPCNPNTVIQHTIDTQYIPVEEVIIKPGNNIYHDTTIFVSIPYLFSADTIQIIKNYYAKNVYFDTIKLSDSLGYVMVQDTVQKNEILNRIWRSKINKITIKETTIIKEKPRNQIYFGFDARLNKIDIFNSVGGDVSLKTKRDKLYNIGVGVSNVAGNLTPYIGFGLQWKIVFRKK